MTNTETPTHADNDHAELVPTSASSADTATDPAGLDTDQAPHVDPAAQLVELDPAAVAQHPGNLRDPGRDLKTLTASIAEVGVLVPLIVVPVDAVAGDRDWPAGTTHVAVDGNRRQAAARAAGMPLPCIVRADLAEALQTRRTMAVTGLVRDGLTPTEEAAAIAALFDAGMSQTAIGRALGRTREQIKTAKKAATLTADLTAATSYPLTLDHLAVLAEWESVPGATDRLLHAIPTGQLEHTVATLRREADENAIIARARAELTDAATVVVEAEPSRWGPAPARPLSCLRRSVDAPAGTPMTILEHAGCPGHAVWVGITDQPEDDTGKSDSNDAGDSADGDGRWEEDGELIPGPLRPELVYLCTDPTAYGHVSLYGGPARQQFPAAPSPRRVGETDEEAAARAHQERETAEAAHAEQRKSERRELIRLNKEADTAQQVRRTFLHQSLTVKSRAKAMTTWALERAVHRDRTYGSWAASPWMASPILAEVLGGDPARTTADTPPARHGLLLWAHVVTAYEEVFARDSHRQQSAPRAAYLQHLQSLGYVLAEVEQQVIDNAAPAPLPRVDTTNGDTERITTDTDPAEDTAA